MSGDSIALKSTGDMIEGFDESALYVVGVLGICGGKCCEISLGLMLVLILFSCLYYKKCIGPLKSQTRKWWYARYSSDMTRRIPVVGRRSCYKVKEPLPESLPSNYVVIIF